VGDPYCARDGESGWRTIENCSSRCGCFPKKEVVRERIIERVIVEDRHESAPVINITNINNNSNVNVNNDSTPAAVQEQVIAPPAPVAAPKVACTQNCPAVEIEKTSPAVIATVPAATTAPVVVCTQNCTPKDVEGSAGTPVPAPAPVPTPTPTPAPVTTGSTWSPD
jgi:hypothetical protein